MVIEMLRKNYLKGFTLIELLVVLAIIALLLTLAFPRYFQSIGTSKETVLLHNLQMTRIAIDKFYEDSGKYPESLDDLINKNYLRSLPIDPVTDSTSTWVIVPPDSHHKGNVFNIKSGAQGQTHSGQSFESL